MVGQSWEWLCARAIQVSSVLSSRRQKGTTARTLKSKYPPLRISSVRQDATGTLPTIDHSRWEGSSITSLPLVPLAQLLRSPLPSSNSALQQDYRHLEACLPSQPAVVLLAGRRLCLGFFVAAASRSTRGTPSLSERSDINLLLVLLHPKLGRIPEPTNWKLPGGAFIQRY